MDVIKWLDNKLLFFDGAMGTMLQRHGLKSGELAELWNLSHPALVTKIHQEYVQAGADVITANTFQANEITMKEANIEEVIEAGIVCAKKASPKYVALDVGPIGHLLEPYGDISFDQAYEVFARTMKAGEKAGADVIIIETLSDLMEAKAAVQAAKKYTELPVFCTMNFQENGYTFMGHDAITVTKTLQEYGVDALGINCSLGPDKMINIVGTMLEHAKVPVMVQANAGLPLIREGKPYYEMQPAQYADAVVEMIKQGVRIVGGCCGTTPEYIEAIKDRV